MFSHKQPTPRAAIIFDFDGTLVDDESIVVNTFNDFAADYGISAVSKVSEIREKVYYRPISALRLLCVRNELKTRILDAIEAQIDYFVIDIEMANLLNELHEKKISMGILTTNRTTTVKKFLLANKIDEEIFMFIESNDNKRKRLKELLIEYNIDGHSSYYVLDQTTDIDVAKNLTGTIAVSWGYDDKFTLAKKSPTHVIDRPDEIRGILSANKKIEFNKSCCGIF